MGTACWIICEISLFLTAAKPFCRKLRSTRHSLGGTGDESVNSTRYPANHSARKTLSTVLIILNINVKRFGLGLLVFIITKTLHGRLKTSSHGLEPEPYWHYYMYNPTVERAIISTVPFSACNYLFELF